MVIPQTRYDTANKLTLAARPIDDSRRGGLTGESWVYCLGPQRLAVEQADGRITYETITEQHLRAVATETRRALLAMRKRTPPGLTPWTFPVLREHVKIARREGSIVDVRYTTAQGLTGLWALVEWTPGAWRDIKALKAQHVSVGISSRWPDETGAVYGPILWEVSLTTHPRAKAIGRIQDTLALRMSETLGARPMDEATLTMLAEMIGEQVTQIQTAIMAELATIKELIAAETGEPVVEEAPAEELLAEDDTAEEEVMLNDLARKLLLKLSAGGLNLSERSHPGMPKVPSPRALTAQQRMDAIKSTGLSGKAASIAFLRQTSSK